MSGLPFIEGLPYEVRVRDGDRFHSYRCDHKAAKFLFEKLKAEGRETVCLNVHECFMVGSFK